jgi:hypothetical protein
MSAGSAAVLFQTLNLGLEIEDFAKEAEGRERSCYDGEYHPLVAGPDPRPAEFEAFNDHLASISDEPLGQPDSYWTQLVKVGNLSLKGVDKLEKEDKKHRMGDLLGACLAIYQKSKIVNKTFYQWLDSIPEWDRVTMIRNAIAEFSATSQQQAARLDQLNLRPSMVFAFLYGVRYLDRASRKQYRLTFSGGSARYNGAPFDTRKMSTVFSGAGYAIWVQSPKDRFYAGNHVTGQFHHSSFLAGSQVKCGGEIVANQGIVKLISAKSGHYQPSKTNFANAIKTMGANGVNLNALSVVVWPSRSAGSMPSVVPALQFLKNPGPWETWGEGKVKLN